MSVMSSYLPLPHEMLNVPSPGRALPSSSSSTTTTSSSFPRLPHEIFNPSTQYYSLFFSAAHEEEEEEEEEEEASSTNRPSLVSLCLQVDNASSARQHLDLHNLLAFSAAQEAINTMLLSNSGTIKTDDSEYCKLFHRLLSSFVHKAAAAVAARERERESEDAVSSLPRVSLRMDVLHKPPPAKEEMAAETSGSSAADQIERELLPVTCPVCLNDFTFSDGEQIMSTPCFHVFHRECIDEWLPRPGGSHCPLCRASMR